MTGSAPGQGPGDAARAFIAALHERRWDDAAAMVLPQAAERHQRNELSVLVEIAGRRAAGQPLQSMFAFSRDAALDAGKTRHVAHVPAPGYRGASTLGDLLAFTPAQFMARTLENAFSGTVESGAGHRLEYAGEAVESDTRAQAFYRAIQVDDGATRLAEPAPSALGLRRVDGRWYVIPDAMMLALGSRAIFMVRDVALGSP